MGSIGGCTTYGLLNQVLAELLPIDLPWLTIVSLIQPQGHYGLFYFNEGDYYQRLWSSLMSNIELFLT